MNKILIHYGTRMPEMTCTLLEAANDSAKIKPSMHVVIKPNLVVSRPASDGVTGRNFQAIFDKTFAPFGKTLPLIKDLGT